MVIQRFGFKFNLFLYLALMPVIERKSTSQMYVEPSARNNITTSLIILSELSILRFVKQVRKLHLG